MATVGMLYQVESTAYPVLQILAERVPRDLERGGRDGPCQSGHGPIL